MRKSEKQLKEEGFMYAGLFGLDFSLTFRVINKLLAPHGLKLVKYGNYREYGDCSWVKIEKLER
jgi:hypothetical protein